MIPQYLRFVKWIFKILTQYFVITLFFGYYLPAGLSDQLVDYVRRAARRDSAAQKLQENIDRALAPTSANAIRGLPCISDGYLIQIPLTVQQGQLIPHFFPQYRRTALHNHVPTPLIRFVSGCIHRKMLAFLNVFTISARFAERLLPPRHHARRNNGIIDLLKTAPMQKSRKIRRKKTISGKQLSFLHNRKYRYLSE